MKNWVVTLYLLINVCETLQNDDNPCFKDHMSGNLKCFVNFKHLNCTWYRKPHPGDGPFLIKLEDEECTLLKVPHDENKFSCNVSFIVDEIDVFDVTVQDTTTNEVLDKIQDFIPTCHIKLDPPENISYKINGTTYEIMWKGNEKYNGAANLQYELQLKKATSSWKEARLKRPYDKKIHDRSEELLSSEFETGSDYDLRLRCKTLDDKDYQSQWSEWSSELRILALGTKDENKVNFLNIIMAVFPLAVACSLLYLFFCSSVSERLKIPFLKEVPTAANFFKPLYIAHNGNFQDWINYPNKCVKRKQEGRSCSSLDSVSTILSFQKENISPIKVEDHTATNEVPVTEKAYDVTSWSYFLQNKEMSPSQLYPMLSPDFSLLNEEEEHNVSEVDCPTVYFLYNGTCIVNSVETED
ncbi:interleukin-21 receptor-like [Mantella aurantiaca]